MASGPGSNVAGGQDQLQTPASHDMSSDSAFFDEDAPPLHLEWDDSPLQEWSPERRRRYEMKFRVPEEPAVACTKVLDCGHPCRETKSDPTKPCRPCREYVKFALKCGHSVDGYCGYGVPSTFKCQGICGKRRRCGHPCVQACGEHDMCERYLVCQAFKREDCDYCIVFRRARQGEIPMPQFFLDQDNGITDDDPLGPRFKEVCKGMTREQAQEQRELYALQCIFKAKDSDYLSSRFGELKLK